MIKKVLITAMLSAFLLTSVSYAADVAATIKLYKQKVDGAAKLFETKKFEDVEKILSNTKGEYFFDKGLGYVFVLDSNGLMLIHPTLKGKRIIELKDINGYPIIKGLIDMALKYGNGWTAYKWAKPGEKGNSDKVSYSTVAVKDGKKYVVGAGVYDIKLSDIYKIYPEETKKKLGY